MPRIARRVLGGFPHHVTQRGHRGEDIFLCDADRTTYLHWLSEYCDASRVDVLAYCLMTNHVHIVAVPESDAGLEALFRPLHTRYALRVNRRRGSTGHVWQGRYFSSILDESYLWAAIRYVERNPVRARMVEVAERYRWSSAGAHCGLREDFVLARRAAWLEQLKSVPDWSGWLAREDRRDQLAELRQHAQRDLPCGAASFVRGLEARLGRAILPGPVGRPRKK